MMAVSTGQNSTDCLRDPDSQPAQFCRHGVKHSTCKALRKHGYNSNSFATYFLYFDLHAGFTLDVFSYSGTYGSEKLVTFAQVIDTPRIVCRPERLPLKTTRQEGRWQHRQNRIAICLCDA